MAARRELTLVAGQLGTTAATLLAGVDAPPSGRVNLLIHNTGTLTEKVILTFQLAGGTARRVARAELKENQQLFVHGLPIQSGDTLLGVTTSASVVDYLITASSDPTLSVVCLEADGTQKGSSSFDVEVSEKSGLTRDGIAIVAVLQEVRDVLLKIA